MAQKRSSQPSSAAAAAGAAPSAEEVQVEIIRSARRTRTVSARWLNWGHLEVRAPAALPEDELQAIVRRLLERAAEARARMRPFQSDALLQRRAEQLNATLFGGALRWRSIRFVSNQHACFGSCTPARGTIRISQRLATVPAFVLDYVITHELAHLFEPNHSAAFWELVYRYRLTERARGYLLALEMEDDLPVPAGSLASEAEDEPGEPAAPAPTSTGDHPPHANRNRLSRPGQRSR